MALRVVGSNPTDHQNKLMFLCVRMSNQTKHKMLSPESPGKGNAWILTRPPVVYPASLLLGLGLVYPAGPGCVCVVSLCWGRQSVNLLPAVKRAMSNTLYYLNSRAREAKRSF